MLRWMPAGRTALRLYAQGARAVQDAIGHSPVKLRSFEHTANRSARDYRIAGLQIALVQSAEVDKRSDKQAACSCGKKR